MLGRMTEASSAGKSAEDAVLAEASSAAMSSAAESSAAAAECVGSPTLREMSSRLSSLPSQASAQQLLEDIPILEEWQRAPHPSNKVRDAEISIYGMPDFDSEGGLVCESGPPGKIV